MYSIAYSICNTMSIAFWEFFEIIYWFIIKVLKGLMTVIPNIRHCTTTSIVVCVLSMYCQHICHCKELILLEDGEYFVQIILFCFHINYSYWAREILLFPAVSRVPTLPGKPGILSFILPGLENAWNLLKNCEKPGILTQNLEKNLYFVNFVFQDSLFKMWFSKKRWFTSLWYLHYQHKHWFKAKLTWDFFAFTWK